MIKELIISCIIHIVILVMMGVGAKDEALNLSRVGDTVRINMVSVAKGNSSKDAQKGSIEKKEAEKTPEKKVEKKAPEVPPKKKPKKTQPVKKPARKQEVEEKVSEKPREEVAAKEKEVIQTPEKTTEAPEGEATESVQPEKQGEEATEVAGRPGGSTEVDDNMVTLPDGSLSVKHQGVPGLNYGFIAKPDPDYPAVARRMGIRDDFSVKVIMQFGADGKLESFRLVDERDKFGFANEVEKAVNSWRLTPIRYKGQMVKMRFYKSFKFQAPV